jgi:hypothetical protein
METKAKNKFKALIKEYGIEDMKVVHDFIKMCLLLNSTRQFWMQKWRMTSVTI